MFGNILLKPVSNEPYNSGNPFVFPMQLPTTVKLAITLNLSDEYEH